MDIKNSIFFSKRKATRAKKPTLVKIKKRIGHNLFESTFFLKEDELKNPKILKMNKIKPTIPIKSCSG
jgi:hypothetical protein